MFRTTALATIAGLPLAAGASIFSFASDNDHTSYTFAGLGGSVFDAGDASDVFVLLIDDDNGPNSPLSLEVEFAADFSIEHVGSTSIFGATWAHNYVLDGAFGFYDGSGAPVLTATIDNALLSALGEATSWGSAAIVADEIARTLITYTWHGADMPEYGLFQGDSIAPEDAAFTLTYLQSDGGSSVSLGADMLPNAEWQSEGSYSGSAQFIPTPGTVGALAAAGLLVGRRRR